MEGCTRKECSVNELQIENLPEILQIEIKGNSLEACLENFFSPEEIDRQCSQCNSKKAMQVTNFVRNPKTLIIQLSRFEYEKKLRRSVKKHDPNCVPPNI